MAGTFTTSGGDTTMKLQYVAETAKVQEVVGDAVNLLWDRGLGDHGDDDNPIVWGDLSNQDKLDILDGYVKSVILGLAREYEVKAQTAAARDQAAADSEADHDLG